LSFIMTHFLLTIGPISSLQPEILLFSDRWWGIGAGCLNYDTFHSEELQKQRKTYFRWFLVTKNHWRYDLTRRTTKHVVLFVRLCSLVVPDRRTTVNVEPCIHKWFTIMYIIYKHALLKTDSYRTCSWSCLSNWPN